MLNVSQNRISSVNGLASVPSLVALNLGGCPRSVFVPWLQRCIARLRAEGRGRQARVRNLTRLIRVRRGLMLSA